MKRSGTLELTTLAGRDVLFVMADKAEYGPCLQQRFTPLMTGIGPVEAAVQLTATLAALALQGSLPDLVVSLGSAGSRVLEQTEVYQATSVAYRDMDASDYSVAATYSRPQGSDAVHRRQHRIGGSV